MNKNHILKSNNRCSKLENYSEEMFNELRAIIRCSPEDLDVFHSYLSMKPEPVALCSLQPTVVNMVAKSSLGCQIDLENIAKMIPNSKLSKSRLTFESKNLGASVAIYKSGKMTSFGAKTTRNCYFSLLIAAKMVHNCGFQEVKFQNFDLSNIFTKYDVYHNIDLVKVQRAFYTCSSYEPELDTVLTFHLSDPESTARIYWNGKVMLFANYRYTFWQKLEDPFVAYICNVQKYLLFIVRMVSLLASIYPISRLISDHCGLHKQTNNH